MSRSITARFFILVGLLAVLSTGAYLAVQRLIAAQEDSAQLVNVSGGQLLQAQRIASAAMALVDSDRAEDRTSAALQLRRSVDVMRNSHALLTDGGGPLADLFHNSATLQRLYFEPPYQLDMRIRNFVQNTENLLAAESDHARKSYAQSLLRLSQGNFPEGLALAVKEYQDEVTARLLRLQQYRLAILASIYLLLALDGLLVLRPLLSHLRRGEDEVRELRRELEDSATHDQLTHALNRHMFDELLAREAAFARRHGAELSVVLLDIRGLGRINAEQGAPAGDRVLEEVAQLVMNNVRVTDYVFRYDGGRFAVLAPSTGRAGGMTLANKLVRLVRAGRFQGGPRIEACAGVRTLLPGDDENTLAPGLEAALADAKSCDLPADLAGKAR